VLVVAVLGGGHGALAAAGDLALRGFAVRLALRSRDRFAELFETGRLTLTGAIEGTGQLAAVTDDHAAAARGADLVLVPLPATAQAAMARRIAGAVHDGQVVALTPGNLGSQVMRRALPGAVFVETATLPYGARQRGQATAGLALVAHHNPAGVFPSAAADPALALLRRVYPAVEPVEDVLSAALLNSNGSLHSPLVLLNAGPIERLGAYDIHVEGTTPGVRRVIAALDAERIALRDALGYPPPHWPLTDYHADADWFYGVDPDARPIPDRTLDLFVAAGTPADIDRGVDRLVAAGARTVTFSGRLGADPLWAIEALGDIVAARG
jgi:opine dehydrogenase